ncbi:hypothetical protein GGS24DRAFT_469155 [Hypoxylon argillaceum]|nr:hypothetical protein GGS24DRAFT_469155 [Hypoxylon argillaceum]KAI1150891.1 hypothetical protein F4825DRAFT_424908 [Nemania diffusa]
MVFVDARSLAAAVAAAAAAGTDCCAAAGTATATAAGFRPSRCTSLSCRKPCPDQQAIMKPRTERLLSSTLSSELLMFSCFSERASQPAS